MDFDEQVNRLNLSLAGISYPNLKNINYFRDYHNYVENSLKESLSEVRSNVDEKRDNEQPKQLTMEIVERLAKEKRYYELRNIMRFSLFVSLYAFVEKVVTNSCIIEGRINKYKNYQQNKTNTQSQSTIKIAKDFLVNEGYAEINNITAWNYIDDMRKIRNRFVHDGGKTTKSINKLITKYDFRIQEEQINLGESFVLDFLEVVESFSLEFSKMVYPDESGYNSIIKKYLNQNK